jgi:ubiquinone/menaquinone biosynthesis C-methylase UbiE
MSRREFFNTAAVTWDELYRTQKLTDFLALLVPKFQLRQGQKVLDVGTGTGILIPFLLEAVGPTGHVTAIDFAEKMMETCKTKYSNLTNVDFKVQQVEKLNFPSATFDAVTCFGLFPHLENKEKALKQMNRVLKPDGKLIIAHALSSKELIAHHRNTAVVAHDALPNEAEMKRLLQQAGFTEVSITDKPGCYVCLSIKPSA